jgi:hypothetical protein
MSKYFQFFPITQHDLQNEGQLVDLTNILRRFRFDTSVKDNAAVYHEYNIQAGDRPDTIAAKYYGDSGYAWVILMLNEIHDPIFGWPLFNQDFDNYIKGKYGSIQAATTTTDHYRKILTQKQVKFDGTIVPERYIRVDKTTYDTLSLTEKYAPTCYEVEEELNEEKRKIKILNKRYLPTIRDEVKGILRYGY